VGRDCPSCKFFFLEGTIQREHCMKTVPPGQTLRLSGDALRCGCSLYEARGVVVES
jgi:hypothetical protein